MHFFNPVPIMKLCEVIRGHATSDETVAVTTELAQKMGIVGYSVLRRLARKPHPTPDGEAVPLSDFDEYAAGGD